MRERNTYLPLSKSVNPLFDFPFFDSCSLLSASLFIGYLIFLGTHSLGLPLTSRSRGRNGSDQTDWLEDRPRLVPLRTPHPERRPGDTVGVFQAPSWEQRLGAGPSHSLHEPGQPGGRARKPLSGWNKILLQGFSETWLRGNGLQG